ncbi:MAG: flavodoxin family protein [Oscillospiraceae bacterium]|nr:flavodoxin family protein [Oscillospiraceae bacterium]
MKRLIIHDVPAQFIAEFSDTSEDILVDANQIHRYCIGCFGCWLKTPGTCVIKDGFENMGKRLSEVSEFILISKATFGSYSSAVKNVLDRSISYVLPFFEIRNGEMHHGERYHNHLKISAVFYGSLTEAEKRTAESLVKANAVNLNAELGKVHFVDSMEAVEEVLVWS